MYVMSTFGFSEIHLGKTLLVSFTHEKLPISAKTQYLTMNILSLAPTK